MTSPVRQVVFLVGGLGSRLGHLTRSTPKPLLPVAGRPLLDHLLEKAVRSGFTEAVLLAGHASAAIQTYLRDFSPANRLGISVALSVEAEPLGTGGAVVNALPALADHFLLVNGDTWFDFDWRSLADDGAQPAVIALKAIDDADRYETVTLDGGLITGFQPRNTSAGAALINGGLYRLDREVIEAFADQPRPLSLENQIAPSLCLQGRLGGRVFDGAFIDIGVPESYTAAQQMLA